MVELTTLSSNYHVEMNPSDVGTKDRYVVQEVIKDMAKSRPIDAAGVQGYKVLVLNEVDRLSKEAQHGLRQGLTHSFPHRLLVVYRCTVTQSPHPPPWPGHSFPFQLNLSRCVPETTGRHHDNIPRSCSC